MLENMWEYRRMNSRLFATHKRLLNIGCLFFATVIGFSCWQSVAAQTTSTGPRFPRIATVQLGNGVDFGNQERINTMKKADVVLIGFWPDWGPFDGKTMQSIVGELRGSNPSIVVINYTNVTETRDTKPVMADKVFSELGPNKKGDWWLRTASGDRTSHWRGNFTINISSYVTADSQGKRYPEWLADYYNSALFNKVDFDGVFGDVMTAEPFVVADWDGDGTNDQTDSAKAIQANSEGHIAYMNRWAELQPSNLTCGNIGSWFHPSKQMPAGYNQLLDCGLLEGYMGRSWSIEGWGGWNAMMTSYRASLKTLREPKIAMLNVTVAKDDYRSMRYGLASALMDDGYFVIDPTGDCLWCWQYWYDEFDVDLGFPVDQPQTAPWSDGVYRREFDNGVVLVNPRGNGSRTVNVGSGLKRFRGTQAPSFNDGSSVTTLTLADADGIILVWEDAPDPADPAPKPKPKPPEWN